MTGGSSGRTSPVASPVWKVPAVVMLALLTALAVAASGVRQPQAAPINPDVKPVRSCADFNSVAAQEQSSEVFDPATGVLLIDTEQAQFVLSRADAACQTNPHANARLLYAEELAEEDRQALCADFRQAIAEGQTYDRGVAVNLDAARQYVAAECG
jgi:hypothetical protein